MKQTLIGLGLALASLGAGAAVAEDLDFSNPEHVIRANRMIQCSTEDGKPTFYQWQGDMFMRRAGESDKRIFKVVGMNVRQCTSLDGGKRGTGYRMTSKEIMLYLDPKTGELIDTWDNPINGRTVNILHVINDPVNGRPSFPYREDGTPGARWFGHMDDEDWTLSITVPLFYHNELGGEYQRYVGGIYHNTEMFSFFGKMSDMTTDNDSIGARVGWVRMGQYLPWMEMQGRDGLLYVHATGKKIGGFDDLDARLQSFINEREPSYKTPPPANDDRPNETSWTYFKKMVEGGKYPRGGVK